MNSDVLKLRTKKFALDIINLIKLLPNNITGRTIANQLVRSATSVGANYRAACRGRSKAEFSSKLHIVLEEADECLYWLEIMLELNIISIEKLKPLMLEANELCAIFARSYYTAKKNK